MLQNRWIYESKVETLMAQWKAEITALEAKPRPDEPDAAVQHDKSIGTLQHKHDIASYHLSSLRGASDDVWPNVKTSTDWMLSAHQEA